MLFKLVYYLFYSHTQQSRWTHRQMKFKNKKKNKNVTFFTL